MQLLKSIADDLGYGDIHCYNPERGKIPTPNIDRLASQGMLFTDAHSSSSCCSPSRYALLTGRYHWRTSDLQHGVVGLYGPPVLSPDRLTIGQLARQHGYRTACIGKWHLGLDWNIPAEKIDLFLPGGDDYRVPEKKDLVATDAHRAAWHEVFSRDISGGPLDNGFDEYFGMDNPDWPPYCYIENRRTVGIPCEFGPPWLWRRNQACRQGPSRKHFALEDILPMLTSRTISFIEREARSPGHFLLYFSLTSPHIPLAVNEEWIGKSGLSLYADFLMETDAVVGRLLDVLENSGISDNTLIVFTSDNGCAQYVGNTTVEEAFGPGMKWECVGYYDRANPPVRAMEEKGHYPSGPFRGYKGSVYEVEVSFSLLPLLEGNNEPVRENAISTAGNPQKNDIEYPLEQFR